MVNIFDMELYKVTIYSNSRHKIFSLLTLYSRHRSCWHAINLVRNELGNFCQYSKNLSCIQKTKLLPIMRQLSQTDLKTFSFNEVKPETQFTEKYFISGKKPADVS